MEVDELLKAIAFVFILFIVLAIVLQLTGKQQFAWDVVKGIFLARPSGGP